MYVDREKTKPIIVGSYALHQLDYAFKPRNDKELDIWTAADEELPYVPSAYTIDLKVAPQDILDTIPSTRSVGFSGPVYDFRIPTLDALYTIKCSHVSWDIQWIKHIRDILYMKDKGAKIIPDLYWKLYKYYQSYHKDKSHLSLNKSKEEFFDDHVNYVYEHDYLHELVALPSKPMFTRVLEDGQEVKISKAKFDQLDFMDQVKMFKEEVCVIALERWLIPSNFKVNPYVAYQNALKKTITNLTKNWATLFIVDNLKYFVTIDDYQWLTNFINKERKDIDMAQHAYATEVENKLKELSLGNSQMEELFENEMELYQVPLYYDMKTIEFFKFLKDNKFKLLAQEGGGEGGAESCFNVFQYKDKTFKVYYSYYSHDGYHWGSVFHWHEVKPVEKTITDYQEV